MQRPGPMMPTFSRRHIVGLAARGLPLLVAARACAAAPAADDAVSLPDFRRPGDPDDSAALARAFATGKPVHAPAGRGSGAGGRYVVGAGGGDTLPSGATLFGDGRERTIVARSYRGSHAFILHCDSKSADPADNITGLRFRDLTFEDEVAAKGYEEFSYLVMLNGVTDALFERVGFRGFRGDGLHLGSSTTSKTERHNIGVTVRDCVFDGITANNRNAISIIDGDRVLIEGSRFLNTTRRGDGTVVAGDPMNPLTGLSQPGSIDMEPNNDAFSIIRDITIRRNQFAGGGGYAVCMLLMSNEDVRVPRTGIVIEDNIVENRFGAFQAYGFPGQVALASTRDYGLVINRNTVRGCDKPFVIDGLRNLTMDGNQFIDCRDHAELGYNAASARVTLSNNLFQRVGGPAPGFGLWVRDSVEARIIGNRFVDCGTPGGKAGVGVAFVKGGFRRLTFSNNRFSSPQGRMALPAMLFREATIDRATLSVSGNVQAAGMPTLPAILGAVR